MTKQTILVTGATGATGRSTVQQLLERGHSVRALVHKEDDRAAALRRAGAEVVVGDLLEHDDAIRATAGASTAYFCYPVRPGLIPATAYFADAAKRAGLSLIVNMSQISAREDRRAMRRAIIGLPSASSTGRAYRLSICARHSSQSGCSIPLPVRQSSKTASSICRMAMVGTLQSPRKTRRD